MYPSVCVNSLITIKTMEEDSLRGHYMAGEEEVKPLKVDSQAVAADQRDHVPADMSVKGLGIVIWLTRGYPLLRSPGQQPRSSLGQCHGPA